MKAESGTRRFFTKRKILAIFVGVILAIAIPLIIDRMFRGKTIFITNYGATDLLQFYGTILSGIALIWAVYLIIDFSMFRQRETERVKMKPFFQTKTKVVALGYFEHNESDLTYVTKHDTFSTSKVMPFNIRKAIESNRYIESADLSSCSKEGMDLYTMHEKNVKEFMNNYFLMSYQLENVGLGNAINVDIKVNGNLIITGWNLSTQKVVPFMFYLDMSETANGDNRDLRIEYSYQDLFSDINYKQQEMIHIYRDGEGGLAMSQSLEHMMSYPKDELKTLHTKPFVMARREVL